MNARRAVIAALVLLLPVLAAAPLWLLPDGTGAARDVPPRQALEAWSEEVLTGAQLPDAEPARRYGAAREVDGRRWWTLARGEECWGVPMDRPASDPEPLDRAVCTGP